MQGWKDAKVEIIMQITKIDNQEIVEKQDWKDFQS